MLSVRMVVNMVVGLYTTRVLLAALGVYDFGTYDLVAGVVGLFAFLRAAMDSATQRFLNFELGKGDLEEYRRVFSMSMTVHITIAVIVILLSQTVGLWLFDTYLNLPPDRVEAARFFYQCSVAVACVGIIQTPYNASILAHEKMSFYAYASIADSVLKISVAFMLTAVSYDRLKVYGVLLVMSSVIMLLIYRAYCKKRLEASGYSFFWDRQLYNRLISFSGWSLLGAAASTGAGQGIKILLNMFFALTVNAALGIANQVNGALQGLVLNFQIASRPQIIKLYALDRRAEMESLVLRVAKISVLTLSILVVPIMLNMEFVLTVWLRNVPQYAVVFCKLILVYSVVESMSAPLWMTVQAVGRIKKYQTVISAVIALNLVFSYLALKNGMPPQSVLVVKISVDVICLGIRLYFTRRIIHTFTFIKLAILRPAAAIALSLPLPLIIGNYLDNGWTHLFITTFAFLAIAVPAAVLLGLDKRERTVVAGYLIRIFNRS